MLMKLAIKNAGKSFKDYAIYFWTLVFGVCVFYMFNSIQSQQELMVVTESTNQALQALKKMLEYISVFVSIVLGFLITYANNFFIKRRKKELGIYLTLGMEKFKISIILVLETACIAIFALICGLALGIFLSQFMSVFTAKIFEADMTQYKFIFSPEASIKSMFYFGIMFLIVIIFNVFAISKCKLVDLLYGSRKNEKLRLNNTKVSIFVFLLSLIFIGVAYTLIIINGMTNINKVFCSSLLCGTIGTFLFFFSLTGFIVKIKQKQKHVYYKDLNMFVVRQLNSKINTNFISMSIVCLVLLLTIGVFSCGFSTQNVISKELKQSVPFDVSFMSFLDEEEGVYDTNQSMIEKLPPELQNDAFLYSYEEHFEYMQEGVTYKDMMQSHIYDQYVLDLPISFISLTDYNDLAKIQGKNRIDLRNNEYAILTSNEQSSEEVEKIISRKTKINLLGKELNPYPTALNAVTCNQLTFINVIVPDEYVTNMTPTSMVANVISKDKDSGELFQNKLNEFTNSNPHEKLPFDHYLTKMDMYQASITTKAMVSFLAIYLGFVFLITSAAILAIQQLSEAEDNKYRYELLMKLGAENSMLNKALFHQIAIYFLLPLMLAVVHAVVGLKVANDVIRMFGKMDVVSSIVATSAFIILIYGAYFICTYIGSKNIIYKRYE